MSVNGNGVNGHGVNGANGHRANGHNIPTTPTPQGASSTAGISQERLEDAARRGIDPVVMRYPETGINVLVAGAGIGGLTCALECWRKGHNVRVLDRLPGPVWTGDNIQVQPSAILVLRHWPDMGYQVENDHYDVKMHYYRQGEPGEEPELIWGPKPPQFNEPDDPLVQNRRGFPSVNCHSRIKLYKAFLEQAERVGIKVEWNAKVVEFWEDVEQGIGGVLLENGQKRAGDIVIAADGLRTKSSGIVPGMPKDLVSSGMACFRAGYPVEYALKDPWVQKMWNWKKGDQPSWQFWLGKPGAHAMTCLTHDLAFWNYLHPADENSTESWVPNVDPAVVVAHMEKNSAIHPGIKAFIKTAPPNSVVNWVLKFRDPHEQWTSPGGRVVQVGDAAHAFLPTSGNGATQAIEDGVTLATCLQLAGKANAPNAARAYNKLRFERVACGQKMAFVNQQIKQFTDWERAREDPSYIRSRYPRWVWGHDPEAYAYEKFAEAYNHVITDGAVPLRNTNIPPGHKFVKWTMAEVLQQMKEGVDLSTAWDGDWS